MKNWKKGLSLACAGVMSVSMLVACKPKNNSVSVDPTTINVEILKASYGSNWVYEVAEKFEAAFADKGYKVNILKPSSDMRNTVALQQLARGYAETQVDLYISGGIPSTSVGQEGEYYESAGILAEELTDMWDTRPIGYNGQEESKTLRAKVTAGIVDGMKDNYGKTYGIPYIASTGGLVVNKAKLAKYGITTLPTTTNELFDMWTTIYCGANGVENSEKSGIFPFTFYNNASNAYPIDWWMTAMAQYDEKLFNEYWSWSTVEQDGSVTWWEDDVSGAANAAYLASAEVMAQAFDMNTMAYNTTTQTLDQAQAQIMKSQGAVFMCNGSWYLNDMALSYKDKLEDITFINFPVVSSLATKLWGTQGKSEADLEATLRAAIAYVDDVAKAADLATGAATVSAVKGVNVTADDMAEVRRARYAYSNRTLSEQMVITKGSTKADIAKLFMRMIASDDAAKTIAEKANGNSAYMTTQNTYSQYTFVKDASKIFTGGYAKGYQNKSTGYRLAIGAIGNAAKQPHLPTYFAGLANAESIYDGNGGKSDKTVKVYKDQAKAVVDAEKAFLAEKLAGWKTTYAERIAEYKTIFGYTK